MPLTNQMTTRSDPVERVNVNLPRPLLDDLRRLVPRSRRSEVIARATARELRRLQLDAMFESLSREPLWRTEAHPDLLHASAIDSAVAELRRGIGSKPGARPKRKLRRE